MDYSVRVVRSRLERPSSSGVGVIFGVLFLGSGPFLAGSSSYRRALRRASPSFSIMIPDNQPAPNPINLIEPHHHILMTFLNKNRTYRATGHRPLQLPVFRNLLKNSTRTWQFFQFRCTRHPLRDFGTTHWLVCPSFGSRIICIEPTAPPPAGQPLPAGTWQA